MKDEIRIYVACLASYNCGILHDAWINAERSVEAINLDIRKMFKASPIEGAEEYAVHDYEGFEGLSLTEYEIVQQIVEKAEFIAEHGRLGAELVNYFGCLAEAREAIEERYLGEYKRLEDFVQESTENQYDITEGLKYYIDYEAMARDWAIAIFWRSKRASRKSMFSGVTDMARGDNQTGYLPGHPWYYLRGGTILSFSTNGPNHPSIASATSRFRSAYSARI